MNDFRLRSATNLEENVGMTDPAAMSDLEIEAELLELAPKIAEAHASGSRIGELEARKWRLQAEQRFREQRDR
jgi:hypothetical protein